MEIPRRVLSSSFPPVSAIGLGAMGLSGVYGPVDDARSIAVVNAALDSGINFIDTADFYGQGHNEMLLGQAIKGRRDEVLLSVKIGPLIKPGGGFSGVDGRPAYVKSAVAYSLRRLGVEAIDLAVPSRVDPAVPIEDTIGALVDLVKEGYVRAIGLSEVSPEQVRRALNVHPIVAVQIEYSIWTREIEAKLLPTLRELGIGLVAYSPLGRGFLTGAVGASTEFAHNDFRRHTPRFQGANLSANLARLEQLRALANRKGCTLPQLAIAWVLARGEDIVAIPGMSKPQRLAENSGALRIRLEPDDLTRIDELWPAGATSGERYPAAAMGLVYKGEA